MSFYAFIGAGRFGPVCAYRPVIEDPGGTDRMNAQLCALRADRGGRATDP